MIDCSHHVVVGSLDDVLAYLDPTTALRISQSEFRLPPPSPHPGAEIEGSARVVETDPAKAAAAIPAEVESVLLVPAQTLGVAAWLRHSLAQQFCTAVNALVADRWLGVDPRFRMAVALTPHNAVHAVHELERYDDEARVAAACMSLVDIAAGHEHYHPLYEALAERGLPLVVHPSGLEGEVPGAASLGGTGPRTPEETFTLLPQVAQASVASLVLNGVFQTFPQLTVVFAGFGYEWAPTLLWRADAEWRNLRVDVPWLTRPPSEIVAERIRIVVDAGASASEAAWHHATLLPDELLVFGSDVPFGGGDPYGRLAGAPERLKPLIATENARATFPRL